MPELAPILRDLGRLEAIQHAFAEISQRSDDRRRHDMIHLRRQLAAQIAEIGKVSLPTCTLVYSTARFLPLKDCGTSRRENSGWTSPTLIRAVWEKRAPVAARRTTNRPKSSSMAIAAATTRRTWSSERI